MNSGLNEAISECNGLLATPAGRAFQKLLTSAIEDWTETLIEINDEAESNRLKGAVRNARYLLKRVEEKPITQK